MDLDDMALPVAVAGVRFRNPFYVGSGPTARNIEHLVKAAECGWAGASIKLTFDPAPYVSLEPRYGWFRKEGFFAFSAETRLAFDEGLRLVEEGRQRTRDFIIMANLAYAGEKPGVQGWVDMAKAFESAGAHIIELNMCCPNMSFNVSLSGDRQTAHQTGASLGQNAEALSYIVKEVKRAVGVPVFVKLTPEGGRIGQVAKACFDAGADAVGSAANRLGIPPIDIRNPTKSPYALQEEPSMSCFSGPWIKPLGFRDVYEMRKHAGPSACITASGGLTEMEDVVTAAMCGGDLMCMCTATMLRGFELLPPLMTELRMYMREMGFEEFSDMRDILFNAVKPVTELTVVDGFARKKDATEPCKIAEKCGLCARICPSLAITLDGDLPRIDATKCHACGMCVQVCPRDNFEMVAKERESR